MNKVILMGRLTRDPDIREGATKVARYTLAVDRRFHRDGEATADFINCVAFGRSADFAQNYFHQGIKIVVVGRIQTGSYTNREGQKVYTTDIIVDEQEFAESKAASSDYTSRMPSAPASMPSAPAQASSASVPQDDLSQFMNIPDGIDDELPFA